MNKLFRAFSNLFKKKSLKFKDTTDFKQFLSTMKHLPYDLVVPAYYVKEQSSFNCTLQVGQNYPLGIVIGYTKNEIQEVLIKVLHLQPGNVSEPVVKLYKESEISMVYPTLDIFSQSQAITSQLLDYLEESGEGILNNDKPTLH